MAKSKVTPKGGKSKKGAAKPRSTKATKPKAGPKAKPTTKSARSQAKGKSTTPTKATAPKPNAKTTAKKPTTSKRPTAQDVRDIVAGFEAAMEAQRKEFERRLKELDAELAEAKKASAQPAPTAAKTPTGPGRPVKGKPSGTSPVSGRRPVSGAPAGGSKPAFTPRIVLVPEITSIDPSKVEAGGPDLKVTVKGKGFTKQSVVNFDRTAVATLFVSDKELTATIPAAKLTFVGDKPVNVVTTDTAGDKTSAPFYLKITQKPAAAATPAKPVKAAKAHGTGKVGNFLRLAWAWTKNATKNAWKWLKPFQRLRHMLVALVCVLGFTSVAIMTRSPESRIALFVAMFIMSINSSIDRSKHTWPNWRWVAGLNWISLVLTFALRATFGPSLVLWLVALYNAGLFIGNGLLEAVRVLKPR